MEKTFVDINLILIFIKDISKGAYAHKFSQKLKYLLLLRVNFLFQLPKVNTEIFKEFNVWECTDNYWKIKPD